MLEGKTAPDFSLQDSFGKTHRLSDYRGKKIVLYFYPRDDTPGCTKEACSFRDSYKEIQKKGAIIIGISDDVIESHAKFKQKYDLPFVLLGDPSHKVIEKYGAWKEKDMYGRKYFGTVRTTFIIDESGKILKIFNNVKVDGHTKEVLNVLH